MEEDLEKKIINNIRALGIDMIENAKSGHPGIVLGAAPIIYTLYAHHLNISKEEPLWINRDRFVLSAGHGSALLYSTLYMMGMIDDLESLKTFRQAGSMFPGHPEYGKTPGVDMTTGPLGQGIASSVGMAIAERYFYNYFGLDLIHPINYYTYVLCGDGDLMEGISYEALSLAGSLKLGKLIILYDNNDISLDGPTNKTFNDNIEERFKSIGFSVLTVNDGESINEISEAITKAKSLDTPTLINIHTVIGKYSKNEGTNKVHGSPLGVEDITNIKAKLDIRDVPFSVSSTCRDAFIKVVDDRCKPYYDKWIQDFDTLDEDMISKLNRIKSGDLSLSMKDTVYVFPDDGKESTRETSSKVLNSICEVNEFIIGGSADLSSSTKTYLTNGTDFSSSNYLGKNIWYGVREHAMGAIMNGLSLSGLRNFGSTFLAFSDYMKPSIRLAALMNLPNIYIFSHDSIFVGEDGPTHEPVEQLIGLRSIPNMEAFRPADANEVLGSYKAIITKKAGPSSIILSRNTVPVLEASSINDVSYGAYIIKKEEKDLNGIIIATGEEVHLALQVSKKLLEYGIDTRVISMPSIERFNIQEEEYKKSILPRLNNTFVIEAASHYSWDSFVLNKDHLFTVDKFGISAKSDDIRSIYKFDIDSIVDRINNLIRK